MSVTQNLLGWSMKLKQNLVQYHKIWKTMGSKYYQARNMIDKDYHDE